MRYAFWVGLAISALLLSGCNTVERRSEVLPKKPLNNFTPRLTPVMIRSSHEGSGSGRTDARLQLAFTPNALIVADVKGNVWAEAKDSNQVLWQVKTKKAISSGPTVINGIVLIGTRDKELLAYDVTNGQLMWQVPMSGEVLAPPVGDQKMLYVHTMDGSIAALAINDGALIWRQSVAAPPIILRKSSRPIINGNNVVVGFSNGRLLALHRLDGSESWAREIAIPRGRSDIQRMTDISADPVIHGNILYVVSYQGRLVALQADSGTPLWEREMSSYAGLTFSNNQLFVSEAKGHITAVNARSGKTLWVQEALQGRRLTKPTVWGNVLVLGDDDGNLHWLSSEDGSFLARTEVDSKGIDAQPLVMDSALYVLTRGGKIITYKLGTEVVKNDEVANKLNKEILKNNEVPNKLGKEVLKNDNDEVAKNTTGDS